MSSSIEATSSLSVMDTLREGMRLSPAMRSGLVVTLLLAALATSGRLVVPLTIQRATDHGIIEAIDPPLVARLCIIAAVLLLASGAIMAWVNIRLFTATETGLMQLRVKAFRHVHDLSVLSQNTERRGSLVSRVTSDVDTISMFVQWGGIMLVLSLLQIVGATIAMAFYSWQLTLLVWAIFAPMIFLAPRLQKRLNTAYGTVRARVGVMLAAISEAVVGAQTIRAYGAGDRVLGRIHSAVRNHRDSSVRAQVLTATAFSSGVLLAGFAVAAVVTVGTFVGLAGQISVGALIAFIFLVQLFTGPVQSATEVLNEMQNAIAGWRRVISVVHTPIDITDPAEPVDPGPRGPAALTFEHVSFAYPGGENVLTDITVTIPAGARVAVVGETGSGKSTLARLASRFADPATGVVRYNDVDLRQLRLADLRERMVVVPQEGFLFTGTIGENAGYGRDVDAATVEAAFVDLGLGPWLATMPEGLSTDVGQRGESLSAGERQLVAIVRAYLADPDVLVLDEATSSVDPATEAVINRALTSLTSGRTSIAIAHRLSTAQAADLVIVVDGGRLAEVGHHSDLVAAGGRYARLHASWVAQSH